MLFQALSINNISCSIFHFLNLCLVWFPFNTIRIIFLSDYLVKILSAVVLAFSELVFLFLMLLTFENIRSIHADECSEQVKFTIH